MRDIVSEQDVHLFIKCMGVGSVTVTDAMIRKLAESAQFVLQFYASSYEDDEKQLDLLKDVLRSPYVGFRNEVELFDAIVETRGKWLDRWFDSSDEDDANKPNDIGLGSLTLGIRTMLQCIDLRFVHSFLLKDMHTDLKQAIDLTKPFYRTEHPEDVKHTVTAPAESTTRFFLTSASFKVEGNVKVKSVESLFG